VNEEEEKLLRSVALQNAATILQASRREEEALVEMKAALEEKTRELAQSLSLLRATLDATQDAILVTDSAGGVRELNAQFLNLWQIPQEIASARQHHRLMEHIAQHFAEPNAFLRRIDEICASSAESFDTLELADKQVIERLSRIQYVDSQPVGRVWSYRDVTERYLADELRFRLAALVESSDDAIVSKTLDGVIVTWNSGAERIFGYTAEEVVGRPVTILIPPDRIEEEFQILSKLRRGEHIQHYETERIGKNGKRIMVSLTVSPVKDSRGRIIGASKIARDITARKQADVALQHSAEELRELAAERESLLEAERAARSDAERMSIMKDEFLATLSHELRTPLNAILGWSQLLSAGGNDADEVAQGLDAIQRNARAQTQLIEDLLDMSRIISGKVRLDIQTVNLANIVASALESTRPAADAKGIRLKKSLDLNSGHVSGDPTRLQQVVWNLINNAIKFTPSGGEIHIGVKQVEGHLEVAVQDTGIGIKPEFLPVMFDRFRQADASTTRSYGGLGLGLSIVKNLVEMHGGTVKAMSRGEGQGATFVVQLPLTSERRSDERQPIPTVAAVFDANQMNLVGVRVLIIDDEPDARVLVSRVLTQCKAEVSTAANAVEALHRIQDFKPDVLVSDIGMPEKDGYQLMREIRALPSDQGGLIPAVALTAFARSEDRTRAMLAGYQMHIAKPIEPRELAATVASLAGRMKG
jgi:PAS domain S-box-containing protein